MKRRLFAAALLVLTATLPALSGTIRVQTKAQATRVKLKIRATRFLDMATFGATPAQIEALVQRMEEIGNTNAFSEWIDRQFEMEPTYLEPIALRMMADDGIDPLQTNAYVQRYRHQAYWHATMTAPDQLLHKLASALLQQWVISDGMFNAVRNDASGQPHWLGPLHYYDTALLRNTKRTYRHLMTDATLHPNMGNYLSALRNRKANPAINRYPDENFAREIMQLFTIGLYEMKPNGVFQQDSMGDLIPTYDNETIKSFARVFTGLTYAEADGETASKFWTWPDNSHAPMVMWEPEHDREEKVLLNGTVLPANQDGMKDISDALDNLMAHPNIAPFVARRLIQRLVKSNPTRAYMTRVSNKFVKTGGDFKALAKAILLDDTVLDAVQFKMEKQGPGVWHVEVLNNGTEDSRLQEPILSYTKFLKAFDADTDYPNGWYMMSDMRYYWTQGFLKSPSVFNFWSPDYQPHTLVSVKGSSKIPNRTLHAPEFAQYTSVVANRTGNLYRWMTYAGKAQHTLINNGNYQFKCAMEFDFSEAIELASNPRALVDHLDILLAHGNLDDEMRENLISTLSETDDLTVRARVAILSIAVAPQTRVTR